MRKIYNLSILRRKEQIILKADQHTVFISFTRIVMVRKIFLQGYLKINLGTLDTKSGFAETIHTVPENREVNLGMYVNVANISGLFFTTGTVF